MESLGKFEFYVPTRLVFGMGSSSSAGAEVRKLATGRALLVSDPGVIEVGLLEPVAASLREAGIEFRVFSEVETNPRDLSVDAAGQIAKQEGCAAVVGVGGGSALDTAKVAAFLATNPGSVRDYDGTDKVRNKPLPVLAIPTTAGTGSEVTGNMSITHSGLHYKMSVRSPMCIPATALLDPGLLRSLPAGVAAASGMDAFCHASEGFLSKRASVYTDFLAIEAMRLVGESITQFVADRSNEGAASRMLLASTIAGMVITHTGTGNGHGMARALGGAYNVHHGLACAIMLAPVVEFNRPVTIAKTAIVARAMGAATAETPDEEAAAAAPQAVARLNAQLGIPSGFGSFGMRESDVDSLVEVALKNVGPNPRATSREDLIALFRQVL